MSTRQAICHARSHAGFTLIEAVISVLIVGGLFVAAINTLAATRVSQAQLAEQVRAQHLAQQLAAEILDLPYVDPDNASEVGPSAYETSVATRERFDDVDDYHGWQASPPQQRDGTAITGYDGWTRSVTVQFVSAAASADALGEVSVTDQGVKRVTVTVQRGERLLTELVMLRTRGWPSVETQSEGLIP